MRLTGALMRLILLTMLCYVNLSSARNMKSNEEADTTGYGNLLRKLVDKYASSDAATSNEIKDENKVEESNFERRILGGRDSERNKHPFMAFVTVTVPGATGPKVCGGSLIDHQFVLTAAHCVINQNNNRTYPASWIRVMLGDHVIFRPEEGEIEAKVTKVIRRNDYQWGTFLNDIAILVLDKRVTYTEKIKPIKLTSDSLYGAMNCTIIGWGKTGLGKFITNGNTLKELHVRIQNKDQCWKSQNRYGQLCVLDNESTKDAWRNVCSGDSGGPLFCQTPAGVFQAGVASYIHADPAYEREPGYCPINGTSSAFMDIGHFYSWIKTNVMEEKNYLANKGY